MSFFVEEFDTILHKYRFFDPAIIVINAASFKIAFPFDATQANDMILFLFLQFLIIVTLFFS